MAAGSFTEELVDYLVTQGVVTKGTDGFYDHLPDVTTAPVVCLYDNGGLGRKHNPGAQFSIGVRVRGAVGPGSYEAAQQKAEAVYAEFHRKNNISLELSRILYGLADGLPESIGRDKAKRSLVVFNMTLGAVE